jgi:hypothetical protein
MMVQSGALPIIQDEKMSRPIFQCRTDESLKQRMRLVGPGFKLRVGLGCQEPGVGGKLDHLHNPPVRESPERRRPFSAMAFLKSLLTS